MTEVEAEELFSTCASIVDVMGGDLRQLCRNRGIPEHYIDIFIKRHDRSGTYDQFFDTHSDDGEIKLDESELVAKLKNFGIQAGVDKQGNKIIRIPKQKILNSVELNLCVTLKNKYGYSHS